MPTLTTWVYPKPTDWNEFENIVWDLFRRDWQDQDAQRFEIYFSRKRWFEDLYYTKYCGSYLLLDLNQFAEIPNLLYIIH